MGTKWLSSSTQRAELEDVLDGEGEAGPAFVLGDIAAAEGRAEDLVRGSAFGLGGEAGGDGGGGEGREEELDVGFVGAVGCEVGRDGAIVPVHGVAEG